MTSTICLRLPAPTGRASIIATCAALLASCAWAQDVVKIGFSGPLSGGAAQYGKNALDGMQMAAMEINASNFEVAGKKTRLEIVPLDDRYNPADTGVNAQRLVQQYKTPAILVPHSGGIFALQTSNERSNFIVLAYSSVPQITGRGNKLTVRIPPDFTTYIAPYSRYVMQRFGKKAALVGADYDYAKAWAAAFKSGWEKLGGTVVVENPMSYNRSADFYSGVSKALAAKPDVLLVGGASEPTALVIKQAREMGFKGGFVVMDQAKLDEMARVLGGDYALLEGAIGVAPVTEDGRSGAFVERYKKLHPGKIPGSEAQWNYVAVYALAKAMQLAGSTSDTKAIRAKYGEAYKLLPPDVNPGIVTGVDALGNNITTQRNVAIQNGKLTAMSAVN
ncbi:ABC transporter substrate-binding protein [Diaphorobacter sp. HDW4A]|uniref:ABC transporter substrate-binding protein n=1 Tax=Diaphorobacter sp. HDW4A TaxID=2714924 RepID=UPI00140DC37E|nr:ABC transporter substrate-binding protein [Diaphorobacter sp. HDW4A]QIL79768.1 ABC transporter substrate-binding protein [Diaphorobacter sp. HDW4A]